MGSRNAVAHSGCNGQPFVTPTSVCSEDAQNLKGNSIMSRQVWTSLFARTPSAHPEHRGFWGSRTALKCLPCPQPSRTRNQSPAPRTSHQWASPAPPTTAPCFRKSKGIHFQSIRMGPARAWPATVPKSVGMAHSGTRTGSRRRCQHAVSKRISLRGHPPPSTSWARTMSFGSSHCNPRMPNVRPVCSHLGMRWAASRPPTIHHDGVCNRR